MTIDKLTFALSHHNDDDCIALGPNTFGTAGMDFGRLLLLSKLLIPTNISVGRSVKVSSNIY